MKKNNIFIFFCLSLMSVSIYAQEFKLNKFIDQQILALHKEEKFSGTVLYYKNDKVLFHKSYGYANSALKIKNAPNYKYNLGSINKLFTKVAIAKLIQSKKLKLTDLAIRLVPELRHLNTHKITIQHLLTMTSGYGNYLDDVDYMNNRASFLQMEDYLPIIINKKLQFEPGSKKSYSNVGFELLGIIVERVAKINYYQFVQKYIFDIAKMPQTGYDTKDDDLSDIAIGYAKKNEKYIPNWELKSYKGTAAGGGYATSNYLLQFSLALLNYEILDKVHTTLLFKKFDKNRSKYDALSVAGGGPGINARIFMNRNDSEVVVILSNIDPPSATAVNEIFKNLPSVKHKP